jgi:hypothetical protein
MKTNLLGLIACVALIGVTHARAADIEYNINAMCGLNSSSGLMSVTGTITTDGKVTGPLMVSDIVSWDLTIKNQNGVAHILSGLPGSNVEVMGPTLTASSSFLRFDYSNPNSGRLVFGDGPGNISCGILTGYCARRHGPPEDTFLNLCRYFCAVLRGRGSGAGGAPCIAQGGQQPQGVAPINPVMHQEASEEGAHLCSPRECLSGRCRF